MKVFGYPMDKMFHRYFMDTVNGRWVHVYEFKGELYMAHTRWSLFKTKFNKNVKKEDLK